MQNLTWVIVANSSLAKVFKINKFPELEEVLTLEHPESRLHNQDLITDRPGRNFQSINESRSAYEQHTEPKTQEIEKFATEVAHFLNMSHQKGDFFKLHVIAAPAFLGFLRERLDAQTQKSIVEEVAKDLTERKKTEIEEHIRSTQF